MPSLKDLRTRNCIPVLVGMAMGCTLAMPVATSAESCLHYSESVNLHGLIHISSDCAMRNNGHLRQNVCNDASLYPRLFLTLEKPICFADTPPEKNITEIELDYPGHNPTSPSKKDYKERDNFLNKTASVSGTIAHGGDYYAINVTSITLDTNLNTPDTSNAQP